jgi:hypothetical protein
MRHSRKRYLLASGAKRVSSAPTQRLISQLILIALLASLLAPQLPDLLARVSPILERVRELQAEQAAPLQHKLDLSRERIGKRLDLASRIAEQQGNAAASSASPKVIRPT